jgi:hypothetical protein
MPDETTDDVGAWLRAILATRPLTAHAVLSRLTADTVGPPDLVRGLR